MVCLQYFTLQNILAQKKMFNENPIKSDQDNRGKAIPSKEVKRGCNRSDSQSFEPEYHQIKKMGLKINKSKINIGEWSHVENQVYLKFLIDNYNFFLSYKSRRSEKVFYRLSKILKKRTPDQCRSHHQKYQLKNRDDLNGIILQVQKKIQKSIPQQIPATDISIKQNPQKIKIISKINFQDDQQLQINMKDQSEWMKIKSQDSTITIIIRQTFIGSW